MDDNATLQTQRRRAMQGECFPCTCGYTGPRWEGVNACAHCGGRLRAIATDTGKVHGPIAPAEILEMRAWLADCEWADEDVESLAELTDEYVIRGVARHYEGGLAQFRSDVS